MSTETQKVIYMPGTAISHAEEGGSGLFQTSGCKTEECDTPMVRYAAMAESIEALKGFVNLAEDRKRELGGLSPEMESRLVSGREALARVGGAA
jgi:hypothetical protein